MRSALPISLACALAACSSIRVRTDHDPDADFSRLHSWAWLARPPAPGGIRENTLVRNRIRDAIERELSARGMVRTDGPDPDFVVGFETATRERIEVQSWPTWCCGGFGRRGWWPGWGEDVTVRQYVEGTLIVGVVDPPSRELLWRGTATKVLDEDSASEETIDEAVRRLFEDFPPPTE